MRYAFALMAICLSSFTTNAQSLKSTKKFEVNIPAEQADAPAIISITDSLYDRMHLEDAGLERDVFYQAYKGYLYLIEKNKLRNTDFLTIADYSQSCNNKRLYVIDLYNGYLAYQTYVSHGKNSGGEYPNSFSNEQESNKSSMGFMITGEVYYGCNGTSLKLDGMENGINNNVRNRDIVFHGSDFVNEQTIRKRGVIGRSYGCPAVPKTIHSQIIKNIKNGSCFFVYHNNSSYAQKSNIINANISQSTLAAVAIPNNTSLAQTASK